MNVEIGTEVAQFRAEKEYINGIFVAVCGLPSLARPREHPGRPCGIIPFTYKSDDGWIEKKSPLPQS